MTYRRWLLALPLLALFVIACNVNALMPLLFVGQQSTVSATPDEAIVETVAGIDLVELEETTTYTDTLTNITFNVSYPDGWHVDEVAGLILVSDESALDAMMANQPAPPAGEIGGTFTVLNSETLAIMGSGTAAEPESVLNFMLDFIDPDSDMRLGMIETVMFVDYSGAIVKGRGNLSNSAGMADLWIATIDIDGTFIIAIFVAPQDEMPPYEDVLFSIMSSITLDR